MYRQQGAAPSEQQTDSAEIHSIFPEAPSPTRKPLKLALIGNFVPRKCGIATFTSDLYQSLRQHRPEMGVDLYVLEDPDAAVQYEHAVRTIRFDSPASYGEAARHINQSAADVVWLQHEYGIFGGECGDMVCDFVDQLAAPLILTCHTVLSEPSAKQHQILRHLVSRASRIMVMSRHSRDLLASRYGAPNEILEVIEHGAPDRPFGRQDEFKARLGLAGRKVLMTFGLLGSGKGLERAIEALPAIVARHPDVLYRIVGATHPNLVARDGESYRERLMELAADLGVAGNIEWVNRFLENDELLDQLEACDVYLTPYPNLQQSTSGTLSYAVALGKAVVSTPYLHALEVLSDGVGILIEPGSADAIATAVNRLFDDPELLSATQERAYARGRKTIWPCFAEATARLVEAAAAPEVSEFPVTATPGISAVVAMSDGTGMLQHSIGTVPNRSHGYCLDDNARALMLMNVVEGMAPAERMQLSLTYASFVQDAWNEDRRRFRNFMRYDRQWLDEVGSDDSNGRALWALGQTVECSDDPDLRRWAMALYARVLPELMAIDSPRTVAFGMLGACAVLRATPGHAMSREHVLSGGRFLERLLGGGRRPDWAWFETVLGYDNPRLSQALIEAGMLLDEPGLTQAGLESLEWIARQQISAGGHFRPIGSDSFGKEHAFLPFDQQPLEAQAAIEAARAAYRATLKPCWLDHALTAWRWFFGGNDRGVDLVDLPTGRCRDGLTPRGANENCGAESILAFQLSHHSVVDLWRISPDSRKGQVFAPIRKAPLRSTDGL